MFKKSIFILGIACMFLVSGCEQLKGPKGDKGDKGETGSTGLVGTKTYSGWPTSNPYIVSCPEITDLSKQIIDCYMATSDGVLRFKLPTSNVLYYHSVSVNQGSVMFVSQKLSDGSVPTYALTEPAIGYSYKYEIYIKTFASAPAKTAYLAQQQKAMNKGSTADYLNNILQW